MHKQMLWSTISRGRADLVRYSTYEISAADQRWPGFLWCRRLENQVTPFYTRFAFVSEVMVDRGSRGYVFSPRMIEIFPDEIHSLFGRVRGTAQ